ncbi:hypothetical protein [Nocardiopsis sp. ATB16-24]|uniref:hypothetical protein n=1 Tax=Nocardiopsis sp. ATB16-24 TaxID=3019555 RepID=UPI002554248A|nr:hypothetical protein [Nocardiopsis sp. ATB16-24]
MTSPVPQPLPDFDIVLRGYDRRQVDELIDRANSTVAALTGTPVFAMPTPLPGQPARPSAEPIGSEELRTATLSLVLRGYDRHQVSDTLSYLVEQLAEAESRKARG